jgi:antitoxin CptB
MRELDMLLVRYLDQEYPSAAAGDRAAFVRILELQDPDLFGYLVGQTTPEDDAVRHVIARIRRDR